MSQQSQLVTMQSTMQPMAVPATAPVQGQAPTQGHMNDTLRQQIKSEAESVLRAQLDQIVEEKDKVLHSLRRQIHDMEEKCISDLVAHRRKVVEETEWQSMVEGRVRGVRHELLGELDHANMQRPLTASSGLERGQERPATAQAHLPSALPATHLTPT